MVVTLPAVLVSGCAMAALRVGSGVIVMVRMRLGRYRVPEDAVTVFPRFLKTAGTGIGNPGDNYGENNRLGVSGSLRPQVHRLGPNLYPDQQLLCQSPCGTRAQRRALLFSGLGIPHCDPEPDGLPTPRTRLLIHRSRHCSDRREPLAKPRHSVTMPLELAVGTEAHIEIGDAMECGSADLGTHVGFTVGRGRPETTRACLRERTDREVEQAHDAGVEKVDSG